MADTTMTGPVDVAVVGLGAMGSAVLYQLARGGVRAVGIDRFAPPHAQGSSHGDTRITRQAVGEGGDYVPFVLASHRIWRELERETGEDLLHACGALLMAPGSGLTSHHGKPDFVGRSIAAAAAFGIAHEVLDGRATAQRFPEFAGIDPHAKVYHEPGGGYVRPERCIAAQLRRAAELGAEIRTGTQVLQVEPEGDGVAIRTADGMLRADRVVVAAGAWTAPLLGAPFDRVLSVSRQVLHWFALDPGCPFRPDSPVFIWMHGVGEEDYLYGFPPLLGEASVKVASEQYRTTTTADAVDRSVDAAEPEAFYRRCVQGRLAGVSGRVVRSAACLYTLTPDRNFIIDQHPASERITVISACSGHGFKHSAGIGEAVAAWLATGRSPVDLAPFGLARLRDERPARGTRIAS